MDNKLIVSPSPHVTSNLTTKKIMLDVIIALLPASIASIIIFGFRSLLLITTCIITCVASEFIFEKICKWEITIGDYSAIVTGLLLALNLPLHTEVWQAVIGSIVAIVVVKELFGGLGKNFANPAITARIVMFLAFTRSASNWIDPRVDATTSATPLVLISQNKADELPSIGQMFLGMRAGSLGETCALALIIGGIYLLVRKVITWHAPVAYIGTVFVLTAILGQMPVYQILSGGLLIGAIFMATDYSTTPPTKLGKVIFGIGAGLITVLIRVYGNYPEGVSFAILLMNILTPYITKLTIRKPLGGIKK